MKSSDLAAALDRLSRADGLRLPDDFLALENLRALHGPDLIDAATNDTLGLARDVSRGTFEEQSGSGASRLVYGSAQQHLDLESEVASWLGQDTALFFGSGYAANLGALSALLSPEDAVFSDRLNHASLIDGIRLSKARPIVYSHLDLAELEKGLAAHQEAAARWVVTESYFSMDGDGPDLAQMHRLCTRYDACLYVDEAHSVGVFGPRGAGLCAASKVRPDVLMVGFGKAVGAEGACILGSRDLRTWLWNRARSFVFSTAPSPARAASTLVQVRRVQELDSRRARLEDVCGQLRSGLLAGGVPVALGSFGPIVSLVLGEEDVALELHRRLLEEGIVAAAIRPPTVPPGTSRLRLVLHASWTNSQIERLVRIVSRETVALLTR